MQETKGFSSVPVIDVSPLLSDLRSKTVPLSPAALAVCAELHRSSQEVGFFYVHRHGVSSELQQRLAACAKSFFEQEESVKRAWSMDKGGRAWRGWFQLGGELTSGRPDQKEGFYFGSELEESDPRVVAKLPMHGKNLFASDEMRGAVLEYMEACRELAQMLMQGLAVGLLGEKHLNYFSDRFTDSPTELFRIFRYPEHTFDSSADEWGVREHTDYGFLTILLQDDSGGLEVKAWDGSWVAAPPIADTFVCNLGDMLEKWTAGRYRATPHRVRNQAHHDRYSFPYFFDPNFSARLTPIDESLLAHHRRLERQKRWDNVDVESEVDTGLTYGDYVLSKVLKVFPQLGKDTI